MHVFQRAQRRVAQGFLLLVSLLLVPTIQAQAPAQEERTAEVFFDTETASVQAGSESSINLVLNTNGLEIDALQVGWEVQGVPLTEVRFELAAGIPFSVFNDTVSSEKGSVYFLPTNPQSPFSSTSPTVLATLYFTPQENGAVTFLYDRESTVIASHDTSENIANVHADGVVMIGAVEQVVAAEVPPESSVGIQTDEVFVDATAPPTIDPLYLFLACTLLIVLIALGVFFLWKRRSVGASSPPAPGAPTAPSSLGTQGVVGQTPQPVATDPAAVPVMPSAVSPSPQPTQPPQLEITPPQESGPKTV